MFRRTLLASVGAMALTGAALAADLPSRAPPPVYLPPPPIFTWTGLYVGINAGGTWSNNNSVNTATADVFGNPALGGGTGRLALRLPRSRPATSPSKIDGFIGGGQIGYNWQFANSFGSSASRRTSRASPPATAQPSCLARQRSPVSQALRSIRTCFPGGASITSAPCAAGWALPSRQLFLSTGPAVWLMVRRIRAPVSRRSWKAIQTLPNHYSSFGSFSNSRVGWTAGGGVEWLFAPNWSVKVEYLYYDLGSVTYGLSPSAEFQLRRDALYQRRPGL